MYLHRIFQAGLLGLTLMGCEKNDSPQPKLATNSNISQLEQKIQELNSQLEMKQKEFEQKSVESTRELEELRKKLLQEQTASFSNPEWLKLREKLQVAFKLGPVTNCTRESPNPEFATTQYSFSIKTGIIGNIHTNIYLDLGKRTPEKREESRNYINHTNPRMSDLSDTLVRHQKEIESARNYKSLEKEAKDFEMTIMKSINRRFISDKNINCDYTISILSNPSHPSLYEYSTLEEFLVLSQSPMTDSIYSPEIKEKASRIDVAHKTFDWTLSQVNPREGRTLDTTTEVYRKYLLAKIDLAKTWLVEYEKFEKKLQDAIK